MLGSLAQGAPVAGDAVTVVVHEDPQKGEGDARIAQQGQAAPEEQVGEQQVPHYVEVPEDVDGEGGSQGDDAEAGQVVEH